MLELKQIKTKTDHKLQPEDTGHISISGEAEHGPDACKLLLTGVNTNKWCMLTVGGNWELWE